MRVWVCVFECKICFSFVLFSPATLFSSLVFIFKRKLRLLVTFKLASGVVFQLVYKNQVKIFTDIRKV